MKDVVKKILAEIIEKLKSEYKPLKIILFDSFMPMVIPQRTAI